MKLGFTGTRKGMTQVQELKLLEFLLIRGPFDEFHHGDCVGADAQAHEIVRSCTLNCRIVVHPSSLASMRARCEGDLILEPKHPLARNSDIVEAVDILIATPANSTENSRSGTWATIRRAYKRKLEVVILPAI